MNNPKQTVIEALQAVIGSPDHDEREIARYFSPDYQQIVDGQALDYPGFVRHMALLKSHTRRMQVSIHAAVAGGETVFTQHRVTVEKAGGQPGEFEVFARFTLAAGRIIRCEELTRMVSGDAADSDLGSRR